MGELAVEAVFTVAQEVVDAGVEHPPDVHFVAVLLVFTTREGKVLSAAEGRQ